MERVKDSSESLSEWDGLLGRFCSKYSLTPQFCDYGNVSKNPDSYREFWFLSEHILDCGFGVWIHTSYMRRYEYVHNLSLRERKTRSADALGIMAAIAGSTIFIGSLPHEGYAVRIDMPKVDVPTIASVYELKMVAEGVL